MIIQQRDQRWWYKLNGLTRYAVVKGFTNALGRPVVLTEFPKSGGTWLSQMLAEVLQIPYPRNRLPMLGRQIIHGCYLSVNSKADTMVVWRDGRDIMVSYYYHIMFDKPITSARFSARMKQQLSITDPEDIRAMLPRFIEWSFTGGYPGFTWNDFIDRWHGRPGIFTTSYEAVLEDPGRELCRVLETFGLPVDMARVEAAVEKYSFANQSGNRQPGEEDIKSFVRKGIAGDWVNHFTAEAREVFDHYAGDYLIKLGYEPDRAWLARPTRADTA